jgi:hypothetical protein
MQATDLHDHITKRVNNAGSDRLQGLNNMGCSNIWIYRLMRGSRMTSTTCNL